MVLACLSYVRKMYVLVQFVHANGVVHVMLHMPLQTLEAPNWTTGQQRI